MVRTRRIRQVPGGLNLIALEPSSIHGTVLRDVRDGILPAISRWLVHAYDLGEAPHDLAILVQFLINFQDADTLLARVIGKRLGARHVRGVATRLTGGVLLQIQTQQHRQHYSTVTPQLANALNSTVTNRAINSAVNQTDNNRAAALAA